MWNAAVLENASKQIINLGGTKPCTINDAAKLLMDITGHNKLEYKEARHEVKWAVPSYQKSVDILGYKDKTEMKVWLKDMWEWAKLQPDREQYKWGNYEIEKGIYSYWI